MTDRLYERDSYCRKFSAVVCECLAFAGKYGVVLDRTAFFPEGGGQAADEGTINGIPVVDVQQKGSVVIHVIESELKIGEEVWCEIDWELRYSRMQGHTGEHIFSGVVNTLYGYDNVGFHMGDSVMIVDFNGVFSFDEIRIIELKSNEAVYKNEDVVAYYPTMEELEVLKYRSKKKISTDVRIVTIGEDIDCCACCAPHVARTGEVGIIKVLNFYSYKQGTRIEMVAGKAALLDYIDINMYIKEVMKVVSSPRDGIVAAVRERIGLYQELRNEYQKLSNRLALSELELCEVNNSVYSIAEKMNFEELRYCSNHIIEKDYDICLLFSKNINEYIYVVSSKCKDVRPIVKSLNDEFGGKGGGRNGYSQGKIPCVSESKIRECIKKFFKKEV